MSENDKDAPAPEPAGEGSPEEVVGWRTAVQLADGGQQDPDSVQGAHKPRAEGFVDAGSMLGDHDWEWESSELEGQEEYTVWVAGGGAAEGQLEKIAVKGELLHFAHGGVGAKGAVPVRRKELAADGFNWEGIAFNAGCELHDVDVSQQTLKCVSFMGVKFVGTADFSGTCIVLKLRLILRSLTCVCASHPLLRAA
jgi:hypothetical protein